MQTYNYISANYNLFLTIQIVTSLEICSFHTIVVQDLCLLGCDTSLLEWYFLTPQGFNVKTLLFESSDNSNPETDRYMPQFTSSFHYSDTENTCNLKNCLNAAYAVTTLTIAGGRLSLQRFNCCFHSDQRHGRRHLTMDQLPLQGVCECLRQSSTRRNLSQAASFIQHGTTATLI
jgi:hypothetical protein